MEMKNEIGFLGMQYFAEKNQSTHRNQNAWFPYFCGEHFLIFVCHVMNIVLSAARKNILSNRNI